jgi:FkbM family methyltransferase
MWSTLKNRSIPTMHRLLGCLLAAVLTLGPTFSGIDYELYEVPGIGKFYVDDRTDWVYNRIRHGQVWEPHVVALLEKYLEPGCVAVDVGAHVGFHTVTMARLVHGPGMVVAFEPQTQIHAELQRNLHLNGVTNVLPLRYAITDENRLMQMDPMHAKAGQTSVGAGGEDIVGRTLDSFPMQGVCLVKMDIEGHEPYALLGAEHTILRERPVMIIEIQPQNTAKVAHVLQEYGYTLDHIRFKDYLALPMP